MNGAEIYIEILNLSQRIKKLERDLPEYMFIGKNEAAKQCRKELVKLRQKYELLLNQEYQIV